MKLIVGLGNPGREYYFTRHNIGFIVLENYLPDVRWSEKFNGLYYTTDIDGETYMFLKPQSYMNLSGGVVKKYVDYFKIDIKDILVIHDDLDLPMGKFRIKINSSAGGHNGIKDIINCLNTNAFARLKIGISNDKEMDTKDYVLGKFSKNDLKIIEDNLPKFYKIIEEFDYDHITDLMNKYN